MRAYFWYFHSSFRADKTSQRPATATPKVVADWQTDSKKILLLRQKIETTEDQPLRKVELYETKEVAPEDIENTGVLNEWEHHKRTAPKSYDAISKVNQMNWEKEKELRKHLKGEKHGLLLTAVVPYL